MLPRIFASLMRRRGGLIMAALTCGLFGYVVYESFGFTAEARRAPLVVAIPAGLAAVVLVIKEIISPTEPSEDEVELPTPAVVKEEVQDAAQEATDRQDSSPPEAPAAAEAAAAGGVSTAAAVAWVLVLTVMFLLLGLLITIPVFTVVFMRVYGRERWRTVLLTAGVVFGMVYVFFVQVLGVRVFGGWMREWLGLF